MPWARVSAIELHYDNGVTHISGLIDMGVAYIHKAPFAAGQWVIDVSGDGIDNVGYSPHRARDAAVAAGVTVNGLAILNENS